MALPTTTVIVPGLSHLDRAPEAKACAIETFNRVLPAMLDAMSAGCR